MYERWSADKVLTQIEALAKKGVSLRTGYASKNHQRLYAAAYAYYGSWRRAIEASGRTYESICAFKVLSSTEVITLLRLLDQRDEPLNTWHVKRKYPKLYEAGMYRFRSWKKVINAAGLKYSKVRRYKSWSEKRVLESLRRLQKNGASLSSRHVRKQNNKLYLAARSHFGSWQKALKRCRSTPRNARMHK